MSKEKKSKSNQEAVAIVGIGCRFPGGVSDPESFWKLLSEKRDAIREVPDDRWSQKRYYSSEPGPGRTYSRWGGFLEDVKGFDAGFFGISPREAESMDPQQRFLLEVAWEALEDSGQIPEKLSESRTGVFVGMWTGDYEDFMFSDPGHIDFYRTQGTGRYTAAGRLSFILGLQGPSMTIDTACSSSLVAVHLARKALLDGECSVAIAGGVNLLLQPQITIAYSQSRMMSPEGRCKFGDASGDGYVRSEGVGIVVLKPLSRALADQDRIYAVVAGSAVNNDGRSSGSFGTPGVSGQEALLREAYGRSGVELENVVYVEAHGTGTKRGDPVEIRAIGKVVGAGHSFENPLYIGSVKTNIGHMEAAAGIGGLIKAALCLKRSEIPASLHFNNPNPYIPWNSLPVRIPSDSIKIELPPGRKAVAGVNSFGISGTNAHIVLEAAEEDTGAPAGASANEPEMLTLSTADPDSLRNHVENFQALLSVNGAAWRDFCFTANTRRSRLDRRLAVWANSAEQLQEHLSAFLRGDLPTEAAEGERTLRTLSITRKPLVFVFSGQGSQWPQMGLDLAEKIEAFQKSLYECEVLIKKHAGWSLMEELKKPAESCRLERISVMWPAIFSVQVALFRTLVAAGVRPDAVVGHSIGEAAAAHASGALSLEDAIRVIVHQGRLVETVAGKGGMLLVGLPFDRAAEIADESGVAAAIASSPVTSVLSGSGTQIDALLARFEKEGVFARKIKTDAAVHSAQMDPIESDLISALAGLAPHPNEIHFVSTISGLVHDGRTLDPAYWWRNLRQPVRFATAIEVLLEDFEVFLELSPHPVVGPSVTESAQHGGGEALVFATLRREENGFERFNDTLEKLRQEAGIPATLPVDGSAPPPIFSGTSGGPPVAFVFSGQGQQWWAMGRELLQVAGPFREKIEEIDALLGNLAQWSLLEELLRDESQSRLDETEIAQPAIFAIQVGLCAQWAAWGVQPDAVIGHSVGEVAAAHVSGALDLKEAVRVIFHRGRLMQQATGLGKMAAVEIPLEEARAAVQGFEDRVAIGASNSPSSTVLSGETRGLEEVLAKLQARGISHKMLPVNYAFHSPQMQPFKVELTQVLSGLRLRPSRKAIVSTVSGRYAFGEDFGPGYWGENVRQGVLFAVGIDTLIHTGITLFVEISAHPVLSGYILQSLEQAGRTGAVVASLRRNQPADISLRATLARLFVLGYTPDWKQYYAATAGSRHVVPLPTYPWSHEKFWVELDRSQTERAYEEGEQSIHSFCGIRIPSAIPLFQASLKANTPVQENYRYYEQFVVPPGAVLDAIFYAASTEITGPVELKDVVFEEPAVLDEVAGKTTQIMLIPGEFPETYSFRHTSRISTEGVSASWSTHVRGTVGAATGSPTAQALELAFSESLDAVAFGERLSELHIEFGSVLPWIESVQMGSGCARLALVSPEFDQVSFFRFHPVLLEMGLLMAALLQAKGTSGGIRYPRQIENLTIDRAPGARTLIEVSLQAPETIRWYNEEHELIARCGRLEFQTVGRDTLMRARQPALCDWIYRREWLPLPAIEESRVGIPEQKAWLIFADEGGLGQKLADKLLEEGLYAAVVRVGEKFHSNRDHWKINPQKSEDYASLLGELNQRRIDGVVHAWSLDLPAIEQADLDFAQYEDMGCRSLFHLTRALADRQAEPRMWIVTRGAEPVHDRGHGLAVAQAPVRALGDVVALEFPGLRPVRVDLDPFAAADEVGVLYREICTGDNEDQVAYRERIRYGCRLMRVNAESESAAEGTRASGSDLNRRLVITEPGILDNLQLRDDLRRPVGPGEIEIEVRATGLNFRDVLTAMNEYAGRPGPLGLECSGVIVAVGPDVADFKVGDAVLGICPSGGFSAYVTEKADLFVHKPAKTSFEEAATIPVTFLTSFLCLRRLARISSADKVLIHSAAGGVGLAAIQIAQQAGAEIYVTVSTAEKRRLMESLGVRKIMNSRSLEFVDEIKKATDGQGVDIVLNSLASDFIRKNFELLKPDGRYLEIGKKDILDARQVREISSRVSYFIVDLMQTVAEDPDLIKFMLLSIVDEIGDGTLKPLPLLRFDFQDVQSAFRLMTRGKHIGKIVVSQERTATLPVRPKSAGGIKLSPEGSYLVTGGLGTLGREMVRWLISKGARHVAVTGRRGLPDRNTWDIVSDVAVREQIALVQELEKDGARILPFAADVKDPDRMRNVINALQAEAPLRGIIHAAGVLNPALLKNMGWQDFQTVLGPKIQGTWNLHRLTAGLPLDFTIYFSSAAAVWGSAELGHYAAANRFLDAMAHLRNSTGARTLSLNFGPFADGMAAGEVQESWARIGLYPLLTKNAVQAIERYLPGGIAQRTAAFVDWKRFKASLEARGARPLLEQFSAPETREAQAEVAAESGTLLSSMNSLPVEERLDRFYSFIEDEVRRVLGMKPTQKVDSSKGFFQMGMDSLMTVELRNRIARNLDTFAADLPKNLAFDYPNVEALSRYLLDSTATYFKAEAGSGATGPGESAEARAVTSAAKSSPAAMVSVATFDEHEVRKNIDELSDDEAEAQLIAELAELGMYEKD